MCALICAIASSRGRTPEIAKPRVTASDHRPNLGEREAVGDQRLRQRAVGTLLEPQRLGVGAERLRNGEQIRFENGESSVFLLNSREASLVSARVKLAELQAKYAQTQATLRWAAGGVEQP